MVSAADREALLHHARRLAVDEYGMEPIRTYSDYGGDHCAVMRKDREQFYLVAKKEAWDDRIASILQWTARKALSYQSVVVCYFNDRDDFYVFDSDYLVTKGVEKRAKSKTHVVDWYEVPISVGCTLESYIKGTDRPHRIDRTRDASLFSFEGK